MCAILLRTLKMSRPNWTLAGMSDTVLGVLVGNPIGVDAIFCEVVAPFGSGRGRVRLAIIGWSNKCSRKPEKNKTQPMH